MKRLLSLFVALVTLSVDAFACTSAIVAAERSSEGAPLLWKHRDSNFSNTRVDYIASGTYAYTALVPNNRNFQRGLFAGINEKGFAAISTATSRMPKATPEEYEACKRPLQDRNVMGAGLRNCTTVDEFEEMLKSHKRRRGFKSNIGVGDATGAVAYFEIWDLDYRRYDVSERKVGFDVRANFSHAGDPNWVGSSKRRYDLIMDEMGNHKGNFSPQQLIGYSRSYNRFNNSNVLKSEDIYICRNYTVPRVSTVGAIVLVCDGENPRMLVMNGHSVSSLAVPVYVKAKHAIPECVHGNSMRLLSNDFRAKAYHSIASGLSILNKDLVRNVLKIKQPKIDMPKQMPANIGSFNNRIDKLFEGYEKQVRRALSEDCYTYPLKD